MSLAIPPFGTIWAEADFCLELIASHLNNRAILPVAIPKLGEGTEGTELGRTLRIGFYPVSADPFHWAHLLIGLSAIARFRLDKIVYIIAGYDARKPEMTSPVTRHRMGNCILNLFAPLFECSPAALEGKIDGESSFFKILSSYQAQRINAFYIAGSDHCRRVDPETGSADTVQKLEEHVRARPYGFDSTRHRVFVIFVRRGVTECSVKTRLRVSYMPGMPFEASSTAIRKALIGRESIDRLALLPYTAYLYIRALGLYTAGQTIERKEGSPPVKRVA